MKEYNNEKGKNEIISSNTYSEYEIEARSLSVSFAVPEDSNQINNNTPKLTREQQIKSLQQKTNEALNIAGKKRTSQVF